MNEEYLKGLHDYLKINADYDTWVSDIVGNEDYLNELHAHLGIKADYETWKSDVFAGAQQEEVKKKDLSTDVTLPTEGGELASGGTEALDQSLQDRLDQGHIDLSTFTTSTDQEAKDAVMESERARVYKEFGIDYAQRQSLLDQKSQIELEKEKAREELTDAKMARLGIKQKEGSDQYYIPTDKGLFSGNFLQNLDQAFTGYDYDDESEFTLGSKEEAEEYAINNYESSDSVVDTEIRGLENKAMPFSSVDEQKVYSKLEEQEQTAIKAEEYLNTRMMNSFIDQGFSGDRLNQLVEESGINTAYVKSKAFMINGEETSPANIEQQIYDRDFVNGLQDGSIKVSIDPAVAETDYGKFLQTTLDVQSNAGSEIGDIVQEFLAGGVSMGAGMLEVAEVVEGPFSEEYMKTGGVVANHVQDYAEQLRNMQRMYKYPGVMEAIRAGAWDDVPSLLGKSIAGSSMQIVLMAIARRLGVNPKITLGALGVSAGGQKSLELKELRESGKIDISNFSLALNSIMSGGFEVLYEIPTYQMIGAVQRTLKGAAKKSAKQVAKEVTDNAFKDIFIKEPGSEMLTEISTMIVDHVTLTEKTDDAGVLAKSRDEIVNRVGNAAIAGMGMATGIRGIGGAGAVGISVLNSIQGKDLTNKIVATYQVVNEDGSLGEIKELTGSEYKDWIKDGNNVAGELNGDIKVNRYNSDIAGDIDDIANTNSEDVVQANNDVNEAGSEANSLLNEIENDLSEAPGKKAVGQTEEDKKVPSSKIAKVKQLLNRMNDIIKETGAKGIQDVKGLTTKLNKVLNKAGLTTNDNFANQNTDNANIQSTETITEIQTEAQAKAVAKALKEGKDPSVVLSQEGVGVSKDGESVSKNNIKLGKFKSKAAAKKALDAFNKKNSKKAQKQRRHVEVQKKNNKEFNAADKGKMDDVSQEDLDGDFNVISAEVDGLDAATNDKRTDNLEKILKNKGLKYKKVTTIENGVSKTSFMVEGIDSAAALDLAVGFGQKSITSSKDGVLHSDGTVEALDGNTYNGPDARDGARVIVIKQNGKKKAIRLGTGKKSFAKKFNSNNIADIAKFVEYLPENQKKILGHVLNFFSKVQGLNIGIVKNTYAMKQQLEADGYNPAQIDAYARNRAIYRGSDGTMYLNLEVMNMNTPFHEIIHPLVNFIKETDPEVYSKIEDMVSKAEPGMIGSPFRKRWIDSNGRRQSGSYLDWVKGQDAYKNLSRQDQIEEAFAEMMGDAAANQFQKDNSKLKQIYDAIREMLSVFNINLPEDKNLASLDLSDLQNIGDLRSGIGSALAKGTSLNVGGVEFTVNKPKNSKVVDNSIKAQVNSQEQGHDLGVTEVTSFEGVETQDIKAQSGDYTPNFDDSKVKRGSISEFNGQKAMLMCIDRSVSGTVESPSGVVKEFNGGMYFSYQEGNGVWAFAAKHSASKVINQAKNSNGLIFLTLMAPQSIDGTVEMFDYVMDEIDNAVKKGLVKKDVALDFLNKKLKLGKVQGKLSREGISKDNVKSISEFRKLILSLEGAFDVRKDLVSKMIKGKDLSKWGIPTREEMYSFVNQGEIKDLTGNPVVAAIRIDTEAGYIDSRDNDNVKDHPTYPYQIKGEPLMVFDQAVDASELWGDLNLADKYLINPKTGIPFSEAVTTGRRNAAVMMATPVVDVRAQADDGFTGGRSQYARFNVAPNTDRPNALIEDLSEDRVSEIAMKGNWSIITGTVEAEGKYNNEANVSNNAKLYKELVEEFGAENIEVVQGVYMKEDQGPSFFVTGITEHRAMQIGKNFSQEGVLTRRGNIFTDGSGMNPASETVFVGDNALNKDGNSTTTSGVTFSLDVNWKSKVPLATGIKAQAMDNMEYTSNALTSLKAINIDEANPTEWMSKLSKGVKGTSKDIATMGLEEVLKAYQKEAKVNSIPKEVVAQLIATNMADIETKILGGDIDYDNYDIDYDGDNYSVTTPDGVTLRSDMEIVIDIEDLTTEEANSIIEETLKAENLGPVYSEVTLPGGENYREFLIRDKSPEDIFTAPHFDELGENLIASARVDDRVGPNGEKILFVQEIQSDWVQGTDKEDFAIKSEIKELESQKNSLYEEQAKIESEQRKLDNLKASKIDEVANKYSLIDNYKKLKKEGNDGSMSAEEYKEVYVDTNSDGLTIIDEVIQEYEEEIMVAGMAIKGIQDEISALDDILYPVLEKIKEIIKKLNGLRPYLPWNQTKLWVGLTIRKLINQASKEGYDQIAFVNGEQSDIVQSHTGNMKGTTHKFYNTVVPPQINKELKRLVKGMRYGVGNIEGITDVRGKKVDQAVINLTPELKAATDKVGPLRFQAGNGVTEDQLTVLKSTYSDIERKYPNINVDEGMIKLYHYSNERLNTVDPRAASRQTYSNQEYRTWGRSRVFFYTDPNIKEGVVGGSVVNETLLPIDRVYPLTEDPLNLDQVVKNNLEAKKNSGDRTQSTIRLNTKSMDSSVLAISKLKSLLNDMGLSDVVDFGDITENFAYSKDDTGKSQRAGVESLSFKVNYPVNSDNITSVIKDMFSDTFFEKIDPATQPFNYFEEMANVAEGLGFQGFIYDHVGGKTVSSWKPVSVVGDRFQAASQEDTDVYVSGLGAIMWDLAKPIIDADYELGGWMSNVRKPSRRYKKQDSEGKMVSTVRATELFGRPKGLHTNQEIKEMIIAGRAQLNHQLFIANKNQKNLKKVIEAEEKRIKSEDSYKNATPEQQEAMLEHLTPEALNNTMSSIDAIQALNPEQSKLREAMTTVRNHIDVLSKTMYEEGLVSGPMRYTIEGNLGYYLTRSYKQYEDSDWRQTDQEVIRRAEVFVMNKLMGEPKNMSREDAEVLAGQMVKDLVNSKDKDSGISFMKNSGISGPLHRVGSIFEKRNEALPKEIRELLGERMDPLTNYVNTISKLSRTLISNQMYEDMIDFGMGKFISEPNPNDPDYSAIPDIGNKLEGKKWGPLDGKFVDNEMLDVLKFYDEGDAEMGLATKAWMTFVYGTKKAATVYNPATHAVNLFGNSYFSLMNGHTSPAKFFESFKTAAGQITKLSGPERQAFYEELISLGVVDSSASLAEVVQIGKDIMQGVDMNKIMDKLGNRIAGKSAKFLIAAAGKADKAATKAYQAEDDLFKIFGYLSEKARYMEAGLSEKEAKSRAVRNTANVYPNYGRVPAVVRAIGRNPFVGTFVSFTAESIRCTKNAIQLSFDEMGDSNPNIKKMGAKRLAASLLTLKFAESLTSAGISMLFGAFGDDEEEFHKEIFGLRHLDAPWNKDSKIAPINKGFFERGMDGFTEENNGHAFVEYMNVSRLSGGGFVKDLLRIAFTDMNTPDYDSTLSRILYKFYGSFLSEDMALGVVRDVIDNKGNKVYNATENLGWNIYDIFKYGVEKLGPGVFKSIDKIEESFKEDSSRTTLNEVRAMVGLRTTTLDVNEALFFKSREIIKDMRDRSESLEFDLRQKDMTLAYTLNPSHEMFDKKMSQYFNGLVSAVQTARRLGVNISGTKDNCIDMLKKASVPQEVIDRVIYAVLNGEGSETLRIGDK